VAHTLSNPRKYGIRWRRPSFPMHKKTKLLICTPTCSVGTLNILHWSRSTQDSCPAHHAISVLLSLA